MRSIPFITWILFIILFILSIPLSQSSRSLTKDLADLELKKEQEKELEVNSTQDIKRPADKSTIKKDELKVKKPRPSQQ